MFCYVALLFGDIDFPQEIPANRRGGGNDEKWVFRVMRNAQSELQMLWCCPRHELDGSARSALLPRPR